MTIFVTGATGFIGYNLIKKLEKKKIQAVGFGRKKKNLKKFKYIKIFEIDIYKKNIFKKFGTPKILIHLAWEGLPNYQKSFHLKKNLPNNFLFLKKAVNSGVKQLIVSGTCFEYGKQEGCMDESMKTIPYTKYAKAKDKLRKKLEKLKMKKSFRIQWLRIFYPYGNYQNTNGLLPSLKKAIKEGKRNFGTTPKSVVRDFISVSKIVNFILKLINNHKINGIINCCSGKPQSVFNFVKNYCKKKKIKINIIANKYPVPDHEPLKFWGSNNKMKSIFNYKS